MGDKALSGDAIAWNRNDPNILSIRLPGGALLYEPGAWFGCGAWFEPLPKQENIHTLHAFTELLFATASSCAQCTALRDAAEVQACAPAMSLISSKGYCT